MNATEKIIWAAVVAKLTAAKVMGIQATWRAEDHRKALAKALEERGTETILAVLETADNHSAWAQKVEAKFLGTGHFVRGKVKAQKSLEELEKELTAATS